MPRVFDDDFFRDDFFKKPEKMNFQLMKTDIRETEDQYILEVDLPGYKKEDIKIDVTEGYLTINAKVEKEDKKININMLVNEQSIYTGTRSFYVGEDIKTNEIKASFKNGILLLEVPKANPDDNLPEKKYIEIED